MRFLRSLCLVLVACVPLVTACSDASTGGGGGDGDDTAWFPAGDAAVPDKDAAMGADTDGPGPFPTDTAAPPPSDGGPPPPGDATTTAQGPVIAVDPVEYTFSFVSPLSQVLTRQFTVANLGDAPLNISNIGFTNDSSTDFSFVLVPPMPKTVQKGKATMFHVRFEEGDGGTGTVEIYSNDPAKPVSSIALSSHLKASVASPEPCASLNPSHLNFGSVERGTSAALEATLTNCSASDNLVLSDITRSQFLFMPLSEEFQIDPMPPLSSTLGPGQTLPVTVVYAPKLAGPDGGDFIFHTNDPSEPKLNLDVSGIGTEPPPEEIGLTIKLSWNADLSDVDSHLVAPGGALFDCVTDCFYSNPAPDWGVAGDWIDDPFLDVDDVDGYGPEHINISEPVTGTYTYVVHYFDDTYDGSFPTATDATVEVLSYGQTVATFGPKSLDQINRTWDVFTLHWPTMAISPLGNTWMISSGQMNVCFPFPFP